MDKTLNAVGFVIVFAVPFALFVTFCFSLLRDLLG